MVFIGGFWFFTNLLSAVPQTIQTPNTQITLEARVTTLEGQVKELRRVVGIEGGLSEGIQNQKRKNR